MLIGNAEKKVIHLIFYLGVEYPLEIILFTFFLDCYSVFLYIHMEVSIVNL